MASVEASAVNVCLVLMGEEWGWRVNDRPLGRLEEYNSYGA